MLRELHIKNFSIIDDLTVEFGEGFTVLTGETGAGKSIVIDALSLALGERAVGNFIRSGENEALIEARFEIDPALLHKSTLSFLTDMGIDIEEGLILKRIISAQGKNRAYIGTTLASVQALSEISRNIIDIHGQYEHQSLLSAEKQLKMIDTFGRLMKDRDTVHQLRNQQLALRNEMDELSQKERERVQRLDMLRFQLQEIETAELKNGEDIRLDEEEKILGNAGLLTELASSAYESLYASDSSCISIFSDILTKLKTIAAIDTQADEALKSAEEALPLLEETGYFLRDYKDRTESDPERLAIVQERLQQISGLKRKYGPEIEDIITHYDSAKLELEELEHYEERQISLQAELNRTSAELTRQALGLSKKRQTAAKKIEPGVVKQLSEMAMPDARFSIKFSREAGNDTDDGFRASHTGIDHVSFLISPNPGEQLAPLAKTASGGELSRIMLALKVVLAKDDKIPCLVFDEVDAGIGGKTAETVGMKLKGLSISNQVICITHLPQIASFADTHMKIEKTVIKDRTSVRLSQIDSASRSKEIARMLSGSISETSVRHAEEMLKKYAGTVD